MTPTPFIVAFIVGWLVLGMTAHAASFDCAKAGTKVEHFICDNPEISKLDFDLNVVYLNAIVNAEMQQNKQQASALKQSQRLWLKDRNKCGEEGCVREAYKKRIEQLSPAQNSASQVKSQIASQQTLQVGGLNESSNVTAEKYPPFPDVWDWEAPKYMQAGLSISLWTLPNGDVLINYADLENPRDSHNVTFFSHETFQHVEQALGAFRPREQKNEIPFGKEKTLHALGCLGCRSGGCYNGLDGRLDVWDKANEERNQNRSLLYLFDKPQHYKTQKKCLDGNDFDYRVESVFPSFLPLADGTFLLVDQVHGLIVRFDQNLNTKSSLINTRLFWMGTEELEKFEAKYGDRAVGDKNLKQLHRDLYRLILEQRKGGQI